MNNYSEKQFLNIWTWKDISIKELAYIIKDVIWYKWNLVFDTYKPDWMPKKLLDVTRAIKQGWEYSIELEEWLKNEYDDFLIKLW